MSPQQITEAQRLADALTEIESVMTRNGYMSPPILEAVGLLRTLAAQAAQERPAVDVDALMANLPPLPTPFLRHWINAPFKDVGLHTDEAMHSYAAEAVRAALEGLK